MYVTKECMANDPYLSYFCPKFVLFLSYMKSVYMCIYVHNCVKK